MAILIQLGPLTRLTGREASLARLCPNLRALLDEPRGGC